MANGASPARGAKRPRERADVADAVERVGTDAPAAADAEAPPLTTMATHSRRHTWELANGPPLTSRDGSVTVRRGPYATAADACEALQQVQYADKRRVMYHRGRTRTGRYPLICDHDTFLCPLGRGRKVCAQKTCGFSASIRQWVSRKADSDADNQFYIMNGNTPHGENCRSTVKPLLPYVIKHPKMRELILEHGGERPPMPAVRDLLRELYGVDVPQRTVRKMSQRAIDAFRRDSDGMIIIHHTGTSTFK